MSREDEGKRGRVTCSWCGKDLGKAMGEEDTGGSCLDCVELALREVDEELGPLEQGQAAVAASSRGRPAELPRGGLATGEGGQVRELGMVLSNGGHTGPV